MDSPRRTPASAHRDSIEIFRSRSTNSGSGVKQLFSHVEIIVPMSSSPTAIEAEDEAVRPLLRQVPFFIPITNFW